MIIFLIVCILIIICCQSYEYFNTNTSTDMDYRSEDIFGTGKYRNYDAQGFAIGKNSVYLAAYHIFHHKSGKCPINCSDGTSCPSSGVCSDGTKCLDQGEICPDAGVCPNGDKCTSNSLSREHSKVFKINKKTKKIEKVYNLTDQKISSHVSAIHVVEDEDGSPIQIIIGYYDDDKNRGLGFYDVAQYKDNDSEEISIKANMDEFKSYTELDPDCLGGAHAPTYLAIDKSNLKLWYGGFKTTVGAHICSRDITIDEKTGKYSIEDETQNDKDNKILLDTIKEAQGLALKDGIFYIGTSYGCDEPYDTSSKIYTYDPKTKKTKQYADGWCGLQELAFDGDGDKKLWGTTEAGSLYYQDKGWPKHPGWIYSDIRQN